MWKDGVTLWSDALENHSGLIAYNSRGSILFKMKQYSRAYDDFNRGIKAAYEEKHVYKNKIYFPMDLLYTIINLADLQNALGMREEAIASLEKAIELNPQYVVTYFKLGNIYYSRGENDKAIAFFKIAIEKDPNSAGAYYALSTIYYGLGNKEESLMLFLRDCS